MTAQPKKKDLKPAAHSISLPATGILTDTSLTLPDGLDIDTWVKAGMEVSRLRGATQWWLGDWWVYSEKQGYGERKAIVEADDWDGPAYQTCMNAATICRAFETSRRREVLSFNHHTEVAPLPEDWQDELLDEVEEHGYSIAALRHRVKEVKAELAQGWTPDQITRRDKAQAGETVVATLREVDGLGVDRALIAWAEANDVSVRIDRQSEWGNPFVLDEDGDRDTVIENYGWYLDRKPSLQKKLPSLKGKVLLCWCHPDRCHGDVLCERIEP